MVGRQLYGRLNKISMFSEAWQWLKEALFPVHCVACGKEGEWWCATCRIKDSNPRVGSFCPVCRIAAYTTCADCKSKSSLDSMSSLHVYKAESEIGQLIKIFKYQHGASLVELWRELLVIDRHIYNAPVIIPVPLFAARERDRDYNQTALLAKIIADKYSAPLDLTSLVRIKNTKQQATLGQGERQENVLGAFDWKGSSAPREVLLIDDVFTTGSTMQACAEVLKKHGVELVHGFTVASGTP